MFDPYRIDTVALKMWDRKRSENAGPMMSEN